MPKIITKKETETQNLAIKLAKNFKGGEVVALNGDLGSGKTAFTKGVAKFFGITKPITSPTFVLMKIYKIAGHQNIKTMVHIDTYRLANSQELVDIGVLEYFGRPDTVCLVEWAEKIKDILPKNVIQIDFSYGEKETERIIEY
ncbi:MAG: tRNA (adenosine(37)-N6)-threonylcarbamoyltransferase complex ATPase subunit type 1 TsaE [Patescibacteria group bacterium]